MLLVCSIVVNVLAAIVLACIYVKRNTNMVVGKYRFQGAAEKRIAKNLARARKLGLA